MSELLIIRSEDDVFIHGDRILPKHNKRFITLARAEVTEERTLELSVSSNLPYRRWGYYEELEHSSEAVDLSRFNDSANVLLNHNRDDYIVVIEKAWLDGDKLKNIIRFDTHELAERILVSVNNGVIRNVSISYTIEEMVLVKTSKEDYDTYRATKWTPLETSLVTVPADASVGVGRSYFDLGKRENSGYEQPEQEKKNMSGESKPTEINQAEILTLPTFAPFVAL